MSIIDKITSNKNIKLNIYYILVFLVSLLAFSIPFGHYIGRKLIVIIFILWIIIVDYNNFFKIIKHKFLIWFILFIFIHCISLLWSEHIYLGLHYIKKMWIYIYFPILIFSSVIKKNHIKYIISGFIIGMFINEIISYLIYFDYIQTKNSIKIGHPVGFIYHITYSVLAAFSAILILYQIKLIEKRYLKIIYSIFFITMTFNLGISGGRTGYIVYFMTLFIMLFTYYKVNLKNLIEFILLPFFILFLLYKIDLNIHNRIDMTFKSIHQIQSNNYNTSIGARIAFYYITQDILKQSSNNVFLGVGTGDIATQMHDSIDRTHILNYYYTHPHNYYIQTYLNTGIIGLFILLYLFYILWNIHLKDKEIKFIQQLFIINIVISIFSDRLLDIKPIMFFFSIFVSIILIQEQYEQNLIKDKIDDKS